MTEALDNVEVQNPTRLGERSGCWKLLGLAALLNAALFAFLCMFLTPSFETNDDLIMRFIASGFYTGHPSEYLVFTNVIIGWLLKTLYGLWGGFNWYLLYLLGVHYVALTGLAFLVVSRRPGWRFLLLYAGLFMLVEPRLFVHLQFTTTAFLIGTVGVLLLVDGLDSSQAVHLPRVIAGFTFIAMTTMIRELVVVLLALMALPFLLERFGLTGWRRLLAACLICAALVVGLIGLNRWYYQRDSAWAEYVEYNNLRGKLHLTPLQRFVTPAGSVIGWSANDAAMFVGCYYSEPEVYGSATRMRLLHQELRALVLPENLISKLSIHDFFLPGVLGSDAGLVLALAVLNGACCVCFAVARRRSCLVALLSSYVLFVALSFYLRETARLPQRVAYNIPVFLNCICLYWALLLFPKTGTWASLKSFAIRPEIPFRKTLLRSLHLLAALMVLAYAFLAFEFGSNLCSATAVNRNLYNIKKQILRPMESLLPPGQKPILIPMPYDSVLEQALFFCHSDESIPFSLVPYGWLAQSPLFGEILSRHRLRPYSLSLVDREDVFFLMEDRWIEPLRTFYREHYAVNIRFETALNTDVMPQYHNCRLHLYQAHAVSLNLHPTSL